MRQPFWWTIVLILQCLALSTGKREKVSLDIILLVDDSSAVSDADYDKTVRSIRKLRDAFEISESGALVAVVRFSDVVEVFQSLSHASSDFEASFRKLRIRRRGRVADAAAALDAIREKVLPSDSHPDVMKTVVAFTAGCTNSNAGTANAVDTARRKLESEAVKTYMIHFGEDQCPKEKQFTITDASSRRHIDDFGNFVRMIKNTYKGERCPYDKICFYKVPKKECVGEWVSKGTGDCKRQSSKAADCSGEECKQQCKDFRADKTCGTVCKKDGRSMELLCVACEQCHGRSGSVVTAHPSGTSIPPDKGKGQTGGSGSGSDTSGIDPTVKWLLVGLGVLVGLMLVALVIGVLIVRNRRRSRKKQHRLEKKPMAQTVEKAGRRHAKKPRRSAKPNHVVDHPLTALEAEETRPEVGPSQKATPKKSQTAAAKREHRPASRSPSGSYENDPHRTKLPRKQRYYKVVRPRLEVEPI